jgi:signal transduction histidine kinase
MTPNSEPQFQLDRIRLRFRDPNAERMFEAEMLRQSLRFIRVYLVAGTLLYTTFGILDSVVGGPALGPILLIRFGVVTPILLGIFLATFFPVFFRLAQFFLGLAMLFAGMGVVAMTAVMLPPYNWLYYAGLIMVVSYCGTLIRLKFRYSVLISIVLFASYQTVCLWINPIPFQFYINNNFFLTMSTGVGLLSAYIQELYIRKAYMAQKVAEEKNRIATDALEESLRANKSKSEFLATMSHELRTPLNAIIGFSEIITQEMFGAVGERYLDYAGDIHQSGSHLLSIINDILDLAKAESGKLQLQEQEFDVTNALLSCVRMCRGRAEDSGVQLLFFGEQTDFRMRGDERLVTQIVVNLLSNSIKFTPSGGSVRLHIAGSRQKGIQITVSDTGIGIAPENIERVLRPFEQVESSMSRSHGGSGLGLPYAKRLAELHGGQLKLESQLEKGTTATVTIPAWRFVDAPAHNALARAR